MGIHSSPACRNAGHGLLVLLKNDEKGDRKSRIEPERFTLCKYFLLHGFSDQLGGSVGFTLVALFGGSMAYISSLSEWEPVTERVDWAIRIVTRPPSVTNALYEAGYAVLLSTGTMLTASRY
jgi:hypothetical protein